MLGQCHDEDRFGGFILDEVQAEITRGRLLVGGYVGVGLTDWQQ